jgi:hypothetical protein
MKTIEEVYDDYLYDCYIANQRLTPEEWLIYGKEEHHIEVPNRDGGLLTPCNSQYLTTYQHWVAGVLQSEVLQKMCFAFVPSNVLPTPLRSIQKKWEVERGLENVRSGLLARIRTPETCSKGGIVSGRNNIVNGHLERLRTPEHQSRAAKSARNKESYEVKAARARSIPVDRRIEGASKVGKASVANQTGIHSPEFKLSRLRAVIITTPEGEQLQFNSIKEAAQALGISAPKISGVCRGHCRHHKGFTARYVD